MVAFPWSEVLWIRRYDRLKIENGINDERKIKKMNTWFVSDLFFNRG